MCDIMLFQDRNILNLYSSAMWYRKKLNDMKDLIICIYEMKILKDIQCNVEYVYGNGNGANSDSCLPQSKC